MKGRSNARGLGSRRWRNYWIWHPLQAFPAILLFRLLGLLPIGWASALGAGGGRLAARVAGKHGARTRRNLALAFPESSEAAREALYRDNWIHLGRLAAEYAVLDRLANSDRITVEGVEHIKGVYGQGPLILFSGHIGHWEVSPIIAKSYGMEITGIYRPPNNRFIDRLIRRLRQSCGMTLIARGPDSVRGAMKILGNGGNLAMLVDQRTLRGRLIPFFGKPVLTAPTIAELALRYGAKLMPVQVVRTRGARFRVICHPPLEVVVTGNREHDVTAILTRINAMIEEWVRAAPEQWLWPHRRWDR